MDFANDMELKTVNDMLDCASLNEIFADNDKTLIIEARYSRKSLPSATDKSSIIVRT